MESLDDDCCYHIFRQLPFDAQLTLTLVCVRFRLLVATIWAPKFRSVHTRGLNIKSLSNEQFKNLFTVISPRIEQLVICDTSGEAFSSYLGRFLHRPDFSFYLTLPFPSLRRLECEYTNLHDGHIGILAKNCPQLEELSFSSVHVMGTHLASMGQLRKLRAPLSGLQRVHLQEMLQNLSHLTHMDVVDNPPDSLRFGGLDTVGLVELRLSEAAMSKELVEQMPKMPSLQVLHVSSLLSKKNTAWTRFLELSGGRVRSLGAYNTSSYHPILPSIADNLQHLSRLETLIFRRSSNVNSIADFLKHPPLKELHVDAIHLEWVLVNSLVELPEIYFYGDTPQPNPNALRAILSAIGTQERKSTTLHVSKSILDVIGNSIGYHNQGAVKLEAYSEANHTSYDPVATYVEFAFHT